MSFLKISLYCCGPNLGSSRFKDRYRDFGKRPKFGAPKTRTSIEDDILAKVSKLWSPMEFRTSLRMP